MWVWWGKKQTTHGLIARSDLDTLINCFHRSRSRLRCCRLEVYCSLADDVKREIWDNDQLVHISVECIFTWKCSVGNLHNRSLNETIFLTPPHIYCDHRVRLFINAKSRFVPIRQGRTAKRRGWFRLLRKFDFATHMTEEDRSCSARQVYRCVPPTTTGCRSPRPKPTNCSHVLRMMMTINAHPLRLGKSIVTGSESRAWFRFSAAGKGGKLISESLHWANGSVEMVRNKSVAAGKFRRIVFFFCVKIDIARNMLWDVFSVHCIN